MTGRRAAVEPGHLAGFTLLELLVAVAIFAVLGTLGYGALRQALLAREQITAHSDDLKQLQMAMTLLERDLGQWVPRSVRDQLGDRRAPLVWTGGPGAVLELTRGGHVNPGALPRSDLLRVSYEWRDGALLRRAWPVLDRVPGSDIAGQALLDEVENLEWRFLDRAGHWHPTWPPSQATGAAVPGTSSSAPVAVEVIIERPPWGRIRRVIATGYAP